MTRVLIVSRHPYPLQTTLRRNRNELLRQGIDVDLVCLSPRLFVGATPEGPGLRVFGIPFRQRRSHPLWYPVHYAAFFAWALVWASVLCLRHRYAVVEVENTPDFLVFTAVVARLRRIRIVLFSMELMPELTAARLRVGAGALPVRVARWLERAATRFSDHVITVSDPCRRILVARGLSGSRITVIPNSHPMDGVAPLRPADPPFLVIQTTLIARYGVHVAIRGLALLRDRFPALRLEILGQGEEEARLIELASGLGLEDRVVFSHGYQRWDRMIDRVRQATLGLVPLLSDGYGDLCLPNKVLELAGLGIPIVCSRLPAIEEHFPGDALAYFEPGDATGLAEQVTRLLTDPASARQQALRAQQAVHPLAWETIAWRYRLALGVPESTPAARESTAHARAV